MRLQTSVAARKNAAAEKAAVGRKRRWMRAGQDAVPLVDPVRQLAGELAPKDEHAVWFQLADLRQHEFGKPPPPDRLMAVRLARANRERGVEQ